MNKNNLSWVDNKVFSNHGTAPAALQPSPAPPPPAPTGVSPATYQDTTGKTPPPAPTGVSPATYQNTTNNQTQTGASPATGVSPAQYQKDPSPAGMPAPGAGMGMSMPGAGAGMGMGMPGAGAGMGMGMPGPGPGMGMGMPGPGPGMGMGMPGPGPGMGMGMPGPGPGMGMGMPGPAPGMGMPGAGTSTPAPGGATGMGMPGTLTRDVTYGPSPLPITVQGPPTVLDPGYIPAYLRTQIGKRVRAEFNVGTNLYMDRTGILREVGVSYFVLEDNVTHVRIMCDLYSLKFLSTEASS